MDMRASPEEAGPQCLSTDEVIALERQHLLRQKRNPKGPLIGLALSGGGVRSATVSLGFLKELFRHGTIEHFDYLSTVSGAGYASGYLYASMAELSQRADAKTLLESDLARHDELFGKPALEGLREAGKYLNRGSGLASAFQLTTLLAATLNTLVLNLGWLATALAALVSVVSWLNRLTFRLDLPLPLLSVLLAVPLLRVGALAGISGGPAFLRISRAVNWVEGVMLLGAAAALLGALGSWLAGGLASVYEASWLPSDEYARAAIVSVVVCACLGFLVNPNVIGLFAVFRERIAAAYLKTPTRRGWATDPRLLCQLAREVAPRRMPYPLFNCCVYLRGQKDEEFAGTQTVDYFLLSPLACGSKLSRYAKTADRGRGYEGVSLADTVTASAASVTPRMDGHANGAVSLAFWSLNLNLGTWLQNPKFKRRTSLVFWPAQYLRSLFGSLSTRERLLYVADGGFIENLGVFELLRRRCRLVVALDNTYDPKYEFKHLRNLVARARAELGLHIAFDDDPEHLLRPAAATGFAKRQYVTATVTELGKASGQGWSGILVYAKACVLAPKQRVKQDDDANRKYKTYHPEFPQESTADQFFDKPQWDAYFTLGRRIFGEVFGIDIEAEAPAAALDREGLLAQFPLREPGAGEHR